MASREFGNFGVMFFMTRKPQLSVTSAHANMPPSLGLTALGWSDAHQDFPFD